MYVHVGVYMYVHACGGGGWGHTVILNTTFSWLCSSLVFIADLEAFLESFWAKFCSAIFIKRGEKLSLHRVYKYMYMYIHVCPSTGSSDEM